MTANLNQLLGTKLNIIQAPMAGVQNWELAVAVSEAGGLGSIPCGMLTPEKVVEEIERFKAHSDKRYNLNFFAAKWSHYINRLCHSTFRKVSNNSCDIVFITTN